MCLFIPPQQEPAHPSARFPDQFQSFPGALYPMTYPVRVSALMRLNRRVRIRTHRWCGRAVNQLLYLGELALGTYYLVEASAPDGYNTFSGLICITVSENGVTAFPGTFPALVVQKKNSFCINNPNIFPPGVQSYEERGITPRISGSPPWGSRRCGGAWRGGPARRRHRSEGRRIGRTKARRGGRNTPCPP